jgi:hypothetical protein
MLYKMKPYQRISQWPGIQVIAHKNKLGQNLMLMRKEFPEAYGFTPATFILPYEMNLLKREFMQEPKEGKTQPDAGDSSPEKKESEKFEKIEKIGKDGKVTIIEKRKKEKPKPNIEKKEKLAKKVFIIKPECES